MVVPFLALYFTGELGYSKNFAGYFLASYGLGAISGSFLGGYLTGRLGSIPVQCLSLFLTAVGFVVLSFLHDFWSIVACLFLLSTIAEAVRPANNTAITEFSPPEKRRQSLALNRLAVNLGMSIGPTVGGFLAGYNYKLLFYADAATCGLAGLLILVLFRDYRKPQAELPKKKETTEPLAKLPWQDGVFVQFWFLNFLTAMVFFQLIATFPIYLNEKFHMNERQIGLALALNTVVIVLIEMPIVKSLEKVNTLRVIGWGCFLSCLGFGILPYGSGFVFCLFTIWVWTMGEILAMPMSLAFTTERSTAQNRGLYMGSYTMCYAVAFVLAPVIGTWIYQIDRELVWHLCLGVGVFVFIGFRLIRRDPVVDAPGNNPAN